MTTRSGGKSATVDLDGPVHTVDFGGSGAPIVLLHGLGGCHLNWSLVAPRLTTIGRVIAVDLPGFGLTPPAGRSMDVRRQGTLLLRFLDEHIGEPGLVVGNSMGGLVGLVAAADDTAGSIRGLVLLDSALPPAAIRLPDARLVARLAIPLLPVIGPRILTLARERTTAAEYVDGLMRFVAADDSSVPAAYRAAAIEFEQIRRTMPWATRAFVDSGRSMLDVMAHRSGFLRMLHGIGCEVLVIHGDEDRLVQVESARWLVAERPEWRLEVLAGVGHVPQLEAPDRFADAVEGWATLTGVLAPGS